jgi:hypothetical protein
MNKRKIVLATLLGMLIVLVIAIVPAGAVTDGETDGDNHPNVVLLVMDLQGQPAFRCSATMLTTKIVLTAGHCTNFFPFTLDGEFVGDFTGMRIFTESDVENGDNNYPFCNGGDKNCVEAKSWSAHPLYEGNPFFLHDVGVVILKGRGFDPGTFGVMPEQDELDDLKTGRQTRFTSVGYGLQRIVNNPIYGPVHIEADRIRMFAEPHLVQINAPGFTGDFSMLLSNNTATGGTCFGDSGGPNFLDDSNVVAGVTSFGLNGNCAGTGGVFRMDRANVLDFVNSYLDK